MQFNILSETLASGLTVTMALTHSLPLSLSLCPLCVLIQKCHCKRDNQYKLAVLSLLLYLKVMAFSRVCYMQNYKERGSSSKRDISVNPPRLNLAGALPFSTITTVGLSLHKVTLSPWSTLGNHSVPRADTLLWETHISLNGKGVL